MNQQLKFSILTDSFGSEKIDQLRQRFGTLGSAAATLDQNLIRAASGTFLLQKAFELGRLAVGSFQQVIDMGDDLNDLAEVTGLTASRLSGYAEAAKISGVSTEALEKNVKKLTMNLGDPNNEKFKDALGALGISTLDVNGKLKSTDDVLSAVTERFAQMQDGPRKAALANNIFGKSGADLIPLLNMGSKAIDELGFKMSNDFPQKAARFNDSIAETKKRFQETQASFLSDFLPAFQGAIDAYNAVERNRDKSFGTVGTDLGNIAKGLAGVLNSVVTRVISVGDIFATVFVEIFSTIKALVQEVLTALGSVTRAVVSIGKGDFANAFSGFSNLGNASKQAAVTRRDRFSSMWERVQERGANEQLYWNLLNGGYEEPAQRSTRGKGSVDAVIPNKKYDKELESLSKFKLAQEEIMGVERLRIENFDKSESELKKLTLAQELRTQALKDTIGWESASRDAYLSAAEAIIVQRQALVDLEQQQRQTFSVGARQALRDYVERVKDVASQTREMFNRAFQNMEDSLVNFVKTGKANFSDFANAIIDDLIRIAVRQATLGVLVSVGMASVAAPSASSSSGSGYLGGNYAFAKGGVMTSMGPMPLNTYANGGIARSPQVAIFGEGRGPEAYVPLPDGKTIPVTMNGAGGGDTYSFSITLHLGSDQETEAGSDKARALGQAIKVAVKQEILNQKRPGGILA